MRHLVLALMIVLLPLRGWADDVMAVEMASMAVATEIGAVHANEMGSADSFEHQNQAFSATPAIPDCHEHATVQSKTLMTASSATDNDPCGTCQTCQACHTLALSPLSVEAIARFASHQLHLTQVAAFTSAASALGQKPPIS